MNASPGHRTPTVILNIYLLQYMAYMHNLLEIFAAGINKQYKEGELLNSQKTTSKDPTDQESFTSTDTATE